VGVSRVSVNKGVVVVAMPLLLPLQCAGQLLLWRLLLLLSANPQLADAKCSIVR
jgi:hypothetical protein